MILAMHNCFLNILCFKKIHVCLNLNKIQKYYLESLQPSLNKGWSIYVVNNGFECFSHVNFQNCHDAKCLCYFQNCKNELYVKEK